MLTHNHKRGEEGEMGEETGRGIRRGRGKIEGEKERLENCETKGVF